MIVIIGKRIILRKLKVSDTDEKYLSWINDLEVNRFLESRFEKWNIEKLKNYVKKINENSNYIFSAIILKDKNRHIGNIKIGPVNKHHKFADIGVIIGEKSAWGKGYATEAIQILSDYAFSNLGLHKLTAGCYGNNLGSVKAFIKAGFTMEARLLSHYLCGEHYVERICLGKINPSEQCKRCVM